jgi:signal transduction histidine kinase
MFQSARITLTTWYLLIIMAISFLFSGFIYTSVNSEFQRLEQIDDFIQSRMDQGLPIPRSLFNSHVEPEMITDARTRVITTLGVLNMMILLISGGAGYFLAGRTLRPISDMVDELSRFVSDASHELRTPLTALRSEIEVNLANKNLQLSDAKKVIESNLEEVVKLQSLSDNLLELTQYEKSQNRSKFTIFSLPEVLEETVKMVQPIAKRKKITISSEVVAVSLFGSRTHLRELFTILLDNAIKYSSEKSTVLVTGKTTGNMAVIAVKDEGIGIDKEDLPHIFDRFYRADQSRSKTTEGFGLGLSIAKKIVDLHKGTISVKSKTDEGTTVIIHLPLSKSSSS